MVSVVASSQIRTVKLNGNEDIPQFIHNAKKAIGNIPVRLMPSVDIQSLMDEDARLSSSNNGFRYGKCFDKSISKDSGAWTDFGDGRIWALTLVSKGALSINFTFRDLKMPHGAILYIFSENKDILYGPVDRTLGCES